MQITWYRLADGMLGPVKSSSSNTTSRVPVGWSYVDGAWDTNEHYVLMINSEPTITSIVKKIGSVQVNLRINEAYTIDNLPDGTYVKITSRDDTPGPLTAVSGSFTYTPTSGGMYSIVFSGATSGVVVLTVGTLAETKQLMLKALTKLRANKRAAGFKVAIRTFNTGPDDLADLSQAAVVAQNAILNSLTFNRQWLLADNSVVSLTAQQVITANNAINKYINDVDTRYFALAKSIITATSTTIETIDITTGWP